MRKVLVAACVALLILVPGTARAQFSLGGQLNWGDDVDLGLGVRGAYVLPTTWPLEIIGSLDYFFPDDVAGIDVSYWEINANIVYLFPVRSFTVSPYAGAGLGIAHASVESDLVGMSVSDTDMGLNILGGTKFNVGQLKPFVELRLELGGGEQFVFTGGAMVAVGPGR